MEIDLPPKRKKRSKKKRNKKIVVLGDSKNVLILEEAVAEGHLLVPIIKEEKYRVNLLGKRHRSRLRIKTRG